MKYPLTPYVRANHRLKRYTSKWHNEGVSVFRMVRFALWYVVPLKISLES